MRIVIFGLSVSSSWGNGHATPWRSLIAALDGAGHEVVFFERDEPCYRAHRDLPELPGAARPRLYAAWDDIRTLVNAWLARGGQAWSSRAGAASVDVGTLHGYRDGIRLLDGHAAGDAPRPFRGLAVMGRKT